MLKQIIAGILLSFSFITSALAEGTPGGHTPEAGLMSMLPMLVIFVLVFYFLLIRPQSKRAKEHKALVGGLGKGDEIVTTAGMLGEIKKVDEHYLVIEIAENVTVTMQKGSVSAVLPKGTLKTI